MGRYNPTHLTRIISSSKFKRKEVITGTGINNDDEGVKADKCKDKTMEWRTYSDLE
jgi:hypothetical protein